MINLARIGKTTFLLKKSVHKQGFCPHVSGEAGIRFRNFWNPLSTVESFEYARNLESCRH